MGKGSDDSELNYDIDNNAANKMIKEAAKNKQEADTRANFEKAEQYKKRHAEDITNEVTGDLQEGESLKQSAKQKEGSTLPENEQQASNGRQNETQSKSTTHSKNNDLETAKKEGKGPISKIKNFLKGNKSKTKDESQEQDGPTIKRKNPLRLIKDKVFGKRNSPGM